jgi:hypothetical protein
MLATGGFLVFRASLSPGIIYLLSMMHSLFAFLVVAMFVVRAYWLWGKKSVLRRMEAQLYQETFAEK